MNKDIKVILASNSPRRIELLKNLFPVFEVYKQTYIEDEHYNIKPEKYVQINAINKSRNSIININYDSYLLISADTIVVLNRTILGKPENMDKAIDYLNKLSGKTHLVYTGVSIIYKNDRKTREINFIEKTSVTFNIIDREEIQKYVSIFNPIDKAGAYGIQEIPSSFIKKIDGDYDNVVGLPVKKLKEVLDKII